GPPMGVTTSTTAAPVTLLASTAALAAGEGRIGGRALGLAKLGAAGAKVPEWLVIPAEALAGHISRNALGARLRAEPDAAGAAPVVRCWGSAFAARALAYRRRAGEPPAIPRMGVVVQRMVAGEVSGVLFTADPVTGRRDHALLTAAWGLGEGVVSGLCNTDE